MKHFSIRTEQSYVDWIHPVREIYETDSKPVPSSHGVKRYIFFHNQRHPANMGEDEIRSFISDLASRTSVSASTQTVAQQRAAFLYRDLLKKDLPYIEGIERAKKPEGLPVVF